MPEPFIGEIRYFAGARCPTNWAFCSGQVLQITQYQALYSLLGTVYGGDGKSTFALPNISGRILVGYDSTRTIFNSGSTGGEEGVSLTASQSVNHTHPAVAQASVRLTANSQQATIAKPAAGDVLASGFELTTNSPIENYAPQANPGPTVPLAGTSVTASNVQVGPNGSGATHENRMPFIVIHPIIALVGIYPPRP